MPIALDKVEGLIRTLLAYPSENPWLEFKAGNCNPEMIGEDISAISNMAALHAVPYGYMIWGVDNATHEIIGTLFAPSECRKGNQSVDLWVSTQLEPQVMFFFYTTEIDSKNVVLLEVQAAYSAPVKFRSIEYIRVESNTKKIKDYPQTEQELWKIFSKVSFETGVAMEGCDSDAVLRLIDYPSYFDMLSLSLPSTKQGILDVLRSDQIISKSRFGGYDIANLGSIMFAKRLTDFPSISRKAVRVIIYNGNSRGHTIKEQIGMKGYAPGFEGLITYINQQLPSNEVLGQALRKSVPMYPEVAVRELVANALVHQDFLMSGCGVMIEIFDKRIEITNPGRPLIDPMRFVDHPPLSRNERLAALMRRIGVCEERGSGFDKVVELTEQYQLPAPLIEMYDNSVRITLFAHQSYADMSREDRIRACYLHSCLRWVNKEYVTNSTLRERFKIDIKNSSMMSRLLKETITSGLIKPVDDNASDKLSRYIPYWA